MSLFINDTTTTTTTTTSLLDDDNNKNKIPLPICTTTNNNIIISVSDYCTSISTTTTTTNDDDDTTNDNARIITDNDIEQLITELQQQQNTSTTITNVIGFDLSDITTLSMNGWMSIIKFYQSNYQLIKLYINRCNITRAIVQLISTELIQNDQSYIDTLVLSDNPTIGINGIQLLFNSIIHNTKLQHLNISNTMNTTNENYNDENVDANNDPENDNADNNDNNDNSKNKQINVAKSIQLGRTLKHVLETNTTIQILYIGNNKTLGCSFIIAFCNGLYETNISPLTVFDLNNMNINTDGITALSKLVLYNNPPLTTFNLGGNHLNDITISILSKSLHYNTTLQDLILCSEYGSISSTTSSTLSHTNLITLFKALEYNTTLSGLYVSYYPSTLEPTTLSTLYNSIQQYNTTLQNFGIQSIECITTLLDDDDQSDCCTDHHNRIAPKQGERQRYDIYNWLVLHYHNHSNNDHNHPIYHYPNSESIPTIPPCTNEDLKQQENSEILVVSKQQQQQHDHQQYSIQTKKRKEIE